ncbi:MAG: zinc ABC transporter substrate-binding protein [Solirubrobacterales bacterium]
MFEPFALPYVQEGLIEILLLSVAAGLVGSWVVLRGLSFYSHAIGTAAFPGLVLADGLSFSPALGAFGMAGIFTALSALVSRSKRTANDSVTALVLVSCLAAGVILASDVFNSGANIDTLLFGSLLAIGPNDLWLAGGSALLAIVVTRLCATHWLAKGFDEESAANLKSGSVWFDVALLGVVAITVTASLSAVGALLVSALIVIPAATVRMLTHRIVTLQVGTVLLVAAEGTVGLWLSVKLNAPPGATIAVVSGTAFALVLIVRQVRKSRPVALAAAAVALLVFAAGCGSTASENDKLNVVATTTQIADLAGNVGGGQINLTRILQPNTDPHDYEPRPSDVEAVVDADIVFMSGGHLDEWTDGLISDSGSNAVVVDLSSGLPVALHGDEDHDHEGEDHEGEEIDPHWWQDPVNVKAAVDEIESTLVETDPGHEAAYKANAKAYQAQLSSLDRSIARCFDSVPANQRKIVTDHDAFNYLASRYGIEVVGAVIPALTTQAQPSAGDLAELERTIRQENVKAIFPESSVSKKLADALAGDTGTTTEYELHGDTLGPDGSDASTYIKMMQANTNSLMLGLTGGERGCQFN